MRSFRWAAPCMAALILVNPGIAQAHFLWLLRKADPNSGPRLEVYFAEEAQPDDPALLQRIQDPEAWQVVAGSLPRRIALKLTSESLSAQLDKDTSPEAIFAVKHDYGVIERGGDVFALRYYAKTGPELGNPAWTNVDCKQLLDLDLVPEKAGDEVRVRVLWRGKPCPDAQVIVSAAGADDQEAISNEQGLATFTPVVAALYSIRARHMVDQVGEVDGKKYTAIRHYSTLALHIAKGDETTNTDEQQSNSGQYPDIPVLVTSFGAAIDDGSLYIFGGHTGAAHAYWNEAQANTLYRLSLDQPEQWEAIATGPRMQGLSLVAHGGKLYRIGGFNAKNAEGEEHDLWSLDDVEAFDSKARQWTRLPSLPEPRSSHDAAVVGDKIYVVGGWALRGDEESQWHQTAWSLDLSADKPAWTALPSPPFRRRALAAAAHDNKLYVIGGMQQQGGPSRGVDIFDPAKGEWTQGPEILGPDGMTGFGASAFAAGGRLYVTTIKGDLQRLSKDGSAWEILAKMPTARFFHRMLPIDENHLLVVGGASMEEGKFKELEVIHLDFD